jgi:hypothetical protein
MNDQAWNDLLIEKVDTAAKAATEETKSTDSKLSFSSFWVRFFSKTIAATGSAIRDEMRFRHNQSDARLTAIEEHLTAIREGRE